MIPSRLLIPLIGAASAFGAAGAVLALIGVGVSFLLAAAGASACAGLVLYAAMPRTPADHGAAAQARVDAVEAQAAALRHDLRGVLSPALMVSDRLLASPDPSVRRAGEAVIRSIERATALITTSKPPDGTTPETGGTTKVGGTTKAGG